MDNLPIDLLNDIRKKLNVKDRRSFHIVSRKTRDSKGNIKVKDEQLADTLEHLELFYEYKPTIESVMDELIIDFENPSLNIARVNFVCSLDEQETSVLVLVKHEENTLENYDQQVLLQLIKLVIYYINYTYDSMLDTPLFIEVKDTVQYVPTRFRWKKLRQYLAFDYDDYMLDAIQRKLLLRVKSEETKVYELHLPQREEFKYVSLDEFTTKEIIQELLSLFDYFTVELADNNNTILVKGSSQGQNFEAFHHSFFTFNELSVAFMDNAFLVDEEYKESIVNYIIPEEVNVGLIVFMIYLHVSILKHGGGKENLTIHLLQREYFDFPLEQTSYYGKLAQLSISAGNLKEIVETDFIAYIDALVKERTNSLILIASDAIDYEFDDNGDL